MHSSSLHSLMEPQIATPNKTLESDPSPYLPLAPQTDENARDGGSGDRGEDSIDSKTSNSEISNLEKKQRRAERFGMQVQLSEEEKRNSRAESHWPCYPLAGQEYEQKPQREMKWYGGSERVVHTDETTTSLCPKHSGFGIVSAFSVKNGANKQEEDKRKARAERFGLTGERPVDGEAKKKALLERFAAKSAPVTPEEEEKRKARALRFSGTSNAAHEVNGRANTEPKATVDETNEDA